MPIAAAGGQSMPVMSRGRDPGIGADPDSHAADRGRPSGRPAWVSGPTAGFGPPPGPMYPMPGPYGAPMFQPPPGGGPGGGHGGYGTAPRWWFDGEYLLWFAKAQPVNFPLLTTSAPNQAGILGQPSTIELVPGEHINYGAISGFRLSSGFFGDADRRFGALVTGFYTEQQGVNQLFATSAPPGFNSVGSRSWPGRSSTPTARSIQPRRDQPLVRRRQRARLDHHADLGRRGRGDLEPVPLVPGCGLPAIARSARRLQVPPAHREPDGRELHHAQSGVICMPIFVPGPFGVPIQVGVRIIPIPVPVGGVPVGAPATVQIVDRFTRHQPVQRRHLRLPARDPLRHVEPDLDRQDRRRQHAPDARHATA